jgi:hypothetical protein
MPHELRRIGDGRQAVLRETHRPVTPFGGLVVFVELLRKMKVVEAVEARLPFRYHSNNQSEPKHILLAFWLGVVCGARRFSQLQLLRYDRALEQLCGIGPFPCDDTVRNFFARFGPAQIAQFFPSLWRWLFSQYAPSQCILDLDSTIFQRFGHQQGAERGYNPSRRNGRIHHPLVAFVSKPTLVLHGWLRSGNTADNRGTVEFLTEALQHMPAQCVVQGVRADSAFFDQQILAFLEEKNLPYTIAVRRGALIQNQALLAEDWHVLDHDTAVGEFTLQLPKWSRPRRFIVARLRLADPQEQRLIPVPGHDFRFFVTNRTEAPEWLWRHYDDRAAIEPRFSELKEDLAADGFCSRQFFATEAAFLSVLFAYILLSILQSLTAQSSAAAQQRPATLRSSLFMCGAIAGRAGHKMVFFLSQSWGGLQSRKPLLDIIASTIFPTSPKLNFGHATAPP